MLKGFNYPLTPKGKSTLNPPPPWYYSSDFLNIEFWSEPSAVAALLPAGLDPDRSANGHANACFYDWQFTGNDEEYLDPARYQYREFFILVDALFQGKPVAYCPYIFVDNDAALARGWTQGYPKRLGRGFSDQVLRCDRKGGSRPRSGIEVRWIHYIRRTTACRGGGYSERTGNRHGAVEAEACRQSPAHPASCR